MDEFEVLKFENVGASLTTNAMVNIIDDNNRSGRSTLQVNTFGATSLDLELQISVDGVNWGTAKDSGGNDVLLVGVSDAEMPFIFNYEQGYPRYYRFVLTNITGTPNIEVWKT